MIIRSANINDNLNIAALSIQVWLDNYAKDGVNGSVAQYVLSEFNESKIQEKIDRGNYLYFLAHNEDFLLGYIAINLKATCVVTGEPVPEIERLYIQEGSTSKGIGSKLISYAVRYGKEHSIKRFWLSVYHENNRAIRFYKKNHFTDSGITFFELDNQKHKNYVLSREIC